MPASALGTANSAPTSASVISAALRRRLGLPQAPRSNPMACNLSHPRGFSKGISDFRCIMETMEATVRADRAGARVDELLVPYVPRLVRAWSAEPDAPRARTLDGSLVSVDISGFTALAERLAVNGKAGAEELVERIWSVFEELIGVAERHGGDVLKFRGDALLLL